MQFGPTVTTAHATYRNSDSHETGNCRVVVLPSAFFAFYHFSFLRIKRSILHIKPTARLSAVLTFVGNSPGNFCLWSFTGHTLPCRSKSGRHRSCTLQQAQSHFSLEENSSTQAVLRSPLSSSISIHFCSFWLLFFVGICVYNIEKCCIFGM